MLLIIIVLPGLETVRAAAKQAASLAVLRREVQAAVGAVGLVVMGQDIYDPVGLRVTVSCIYNFSDRAAVSSE